MDRRHIFVPADSKSLDPPIFHGRIVPSVVFSRKGKLITVN
jgi:hypothetical protein